MSVVGNQKDSTRIGKACFEKGGPFFYLFLYRSIAIKNKWGPKRMAILHNFFDEVNIVEVSQSPVNLYAEIDTCKQYANPNFKTYPFNTPGNMGNNDLWIAKVAALPGLERITIDADFEHLHHVFFPLRKLIASEFLPFFS